MSTEFHSELPAQSYDANQTVRLIMASFRFSRGIPAVQDEIFEYWAAHPDYSYSFSTEALDLSMPKLIVAAGNYIYHSGLHRSPDLGDHDSLEEGIKSTLISEIAVLEGFLGKDSRGQGSTITDLQDSFGETLFADKSRIPFRNARNAHDRSVPLKFRSNVVDLGLLKKGSGMIEIDSYFQDITSAYYAGVPYEDPERHSYVASDLVEVVAAHLAYNPEDLAALSAITK